MTFTGEAFTGDVELLGEGDDDEITLNVPFSSGTLSTDGGDGVTATFCS